MPDLGEGELNICMSDCLILGMAARYGTRAGQAPRLCLHATRLTFEHIRTQEVMTFDVPPPALFERLLD